MPSAPRSPSLSANDEALDKQAAFLSNLQQAGLISSSSGTTKRESASGPSAFSSKDKPLLKEPFRWFAGLSPKRHSKDDPDAAASSPRSSAQLTDSPSSLFSSSGASSASSMPAFASPKSYSHTHPYSLPDMLSGSAMSPDRDEEDNCPVCLESLSLRLRGEKPHIVPVCGHKLHEACFEAVYGSVNRARNRPGSLGLCGVCRRDMKLGDPSEHGRNKFAALSGLPGGGRHASPLDTHKVRSISKKTLPSDTTGGRATHDPNEDDAPIFGRVADLGHSQRGSGDTVMGFANNRTAAGKVVGGGLIPAHPSMPHAGPSAHTSPQAEYLASVQHVVASPKITVRAEHTQVARNADREKKTNITCMITIEMPSKLDRNVRHQLSLSSSGFDQGPPLPELPNPPPQDPTATRNSHYHPERSSEGHEDPEYGLTPAYMTESDPFEHIVKDLTDRMADWKGHSPKDFGKLHMYDLLQVRKDKKIRDFNIYLFSEALLCVSDDGRKAGSRDQLPEPHDKLRLKGRVFIRHIGKVDNTSEPASEDSAGENSLTISMQDEDTPDTFVILFKTPGQLQHWKARIEGLVSSRSSLTQKRSMNSIRDSTHSGDTAQSLPSSATATSSTYSKYSRTTMSSAPNTGNKEMATLQEEPADDAYLEHFRNAYPRMPNMTAADSMLTLKAGNSPTPNLPHDFPSLDLILILSVPAPTNVPSSYQLKLRLIKSTLDFVINNIGPRGRISVVTYSCGEGTRGILRKTPLLAVGRTDSRRRLTDFCDSIGNEVASEFEPLSALDQRDERISVVTAVNLALDIVLQRKAKSALTGMVLMNDGRDGAQKQQMDLAMARAEAASVPIHTFGWGKGHDPSSLWLLSNHTGGSYTFVKDLYGLRDSIAGCVGGILSVAANAVKLFVSVQEPRWFRIRKVAGVSNAIVGSDGREVDITLGELRAGERREILVEVEMGGSNRRRQSSMMETHNYSSATDDFLRKAGLNPLSLMDDSNDFYEDDYYTLIDDVPLFEVNASFRDPVAGRHFSRLPVPALLMVSIAPPADLNRPVTNNSDPAVVRRRVELLCSDMQTRCLLLMSRRNPQQAQRLLTETRRIVGTILANLSNITTDGHERSQQGENALTASTLAACMEDIDLLLDGVDQRDQFDTVHRNHAAQSAVILRDQRAWTGRSITERLFWNADFSLWMAHRSSQWMAPT